MPVITSFAVELHIPQMCDIFLSTFNKYVWISLQIFVNKFLVQVGNKPGQILMPSKYLLNDTIILGFNNVKSNIYVEMESF